MPPLYNHGHADALSITLSLNGMPIIVDPGTYRYNGEPDFRRYFKGTRAHNTVTVDGEDQAVQETGFIWSRPYRACLTEAKMVEGAFILDACHDGYKRLGSPLVHRRRMLVSDRGIYLIRDSFAGSGSHDFELNFHLHPTMRVENGNNGWVISKDEGMQVHIASHDPLQFASGWRNPILGWYSSAYGVLEESGVLRGVKRGEAGEICFLTVIRWGADGEAADRASSSRDNIPAEFLTEISSTCNHAET
jgi:hypothetical protein